MTTFAKKPFSLLISALVLTACSSTEEIASNEEINSQQQELSGRVEKEFDFNTQDLVSQPYSYSTTVDILGAAFEATPEQALPPVFDLESSFNRQDKLDLYTLIEKVNKKYQSYGIVVSLSDDARSYIESKLASKSEDKPQTYSSDDSSGVIAISALDKSSLQQHTSTKGYTTKFSVGRSSLRQVLNLIGANTNLWWKYVDGRVTIYRVEPATFLVDSNGKTYTKSFNQSARADTTENNSGSTFQANETGKNALEEIKAQVELMLTEDGKVYVNQSDHSITVKDTPPTIKAVKRFLKGYNRRATTQYAVRVDVFEIITEVNKNQNVDWEAKFETAATKFGVGSPSFVPSTATGNLSASVVTGNWNVGAAIQMLHKDASIYSYIHKTGKTKNAIPTIVSSVEDRGIVSGRSVTINSDGFSQESIETKLIDEGFSITATPRITSMGRIDLDVTVNTKVIKKVETVKTDKQEIQLEETRKQNNTANVILRDGDTSIVSAYERYLTSADVQSLAENFPWWAGGANGARQYKSNLIVVVQPTIVER
ncbi:type II and III secretion system protein [Vibrio tubiashii]|uniref:type II and III secretion system protein n=1 Tax=Vibrio tubiashii TaxID=29498 RepID=UPI001EFEA054|nr:type II and III secretion system protein [Vibrio tubiashii]MCG9578617.1 type II and III secretion system protein [Vibrio tubiashii]